MNNTLILTPEQIADILARAEKATLPPWTDDSYNTVFSGSGDRIWELESRLKEIEKGNAGALALLGRTENDYFGSPQPQQFALEIKQLTDRLKESVEDVRAQLTAAQSQLAAKDAQLAEARRFVEQAVRHGRLQHREDTHEVCYDWCPACAIGNALARLTPEAGEEPAGVSEADDERFEGDDDYRFSCSKD